ncbi:MAG: ribonuclease P protein component [Patescibacteria group bacterium]
MALPRKNRITSKKEIDHVFKRGKVIRGDFLSLRFVSNQLDYSRFAFIIPSKFISLAVDRNRIKRLLSEKVREVGTIASDSRDIVVVVSKKVKRNEFNDLTKEMVKHLSRQ